MTNANSRVSSKGPIALAHDSTKLWYVQLHTIENRKVVFRPLRLRLSSLEEVSVSLGCRQLVKHWTSNISFLGISRSETESTQASINQKIMN